MTPKTSLKGAISRGVFPHQVSWLLELPLRKLIIAPEDIAERSGMTASSTVLELGPGSGFFSRHLASRLQAGRLELLDLQFEMLRKARNKLHAFDNVGYTVADAAYLPYEEATFDVVIMVSVLGEVPQPATCLRSVHRVLRPAGRLLCHESFPDPDLIRFTDLVQLAQRSNLLFEKRWGKSWNYTATFRRGVQRADEGSKETPMKITVETVVKAELNKVWDAWNNPADIKQWNTAQEDWHTTRSSVDLREGGKFVARMEAKDGSEGFDFGGTYTRIVPHKTIEYRMSDGREAKVEFIERPGGVLVKETFDAETENPAELQRTGWQAILDNFGRHVEAKD